MIALSKLAQEVKLSEIRQMYDLALAYKDKVNFTLGEPDFVTPGNIIEVACEHMRMGETHYTPNAGIMPLRETIAKKYSKRMNIPIAPESNVIVTASASEALVLTMQAILNEGDEVMLTSPYWTSYIGHIQVAKGVPNFVHVYEENEWVLTCEELEKSITPKSRILILTSPANPTGAVIDKKTLEGIADIVKRHNLVVISDEVYREIRYSDEPYTSIASLPGMAERTIVIDSFSKTYAMTGWRIGYAIGPAHVVAAMVRLIEASVSCVFAPFQYAGIEALENSHVQVDEMIKKYASRRKVMCEGINSIKGMSCVWPKGAFYVMPNIKELGIASKEFAVRLLERTGVVVVPGSGLGPNGEGYLRMTFAVNEEMIQEGLGRMEHFIKNDL